jgi:hypothetical protein
MTWHNDQISLIASSKLIMLVLFGQQHLLIGVFKMCQAGRFHTQVLYVCLQEIHHKILITVDLLNITFMTY